MSDTASKFALLAAQMADHETSWSLGTFGAIAEFTRDADEPVTLSRDDACVAAAVMRIAENGAASGMPEWPSP